MDEQAKKLKKIIEDAEKTIEQAKNALREVSPESVYGSKEFKSGQEEGKIVEGWFDGQSMYDETGKLYPIPANYASKSKLVEGDKLKLTISDDGSFVFKQIGPIERKRVIGVLKQDISTRGYMVDVDGKQYKVLLASVTYFKVNEGESVVLLIPRDKPSVWGAIENVLRGGGSISPGEETNFSNLNGGNFGENTERKPRRLKPDKIQNLDEIIGEVISSTPELSQSEDGKGAQKDEFEW